MLLRRLLLLTAAGLTLVTCSEDTATGNYRGAYGDMQLKQVPLLIAATRGTPVPTSLDTGICMTGTPDSFKVTLTEVVVAGMFLEKPTDGGEEKEVYDNYVVWKGEKSLQLDTRTIDIVGADSLPRGTIQNVILRFKSGAKVKGSVYRTRIAVDTIKKALVAPADSSLADTSRYIRKDTTRLVRTCGDTLRGPCRDTMFEVRTYIARSGKPPDTVMRTDTAILVRSVRVADTFSTKSAYWYNAARDTGGADSASRFLGSASQESDIYLRSSTNDLTVSLTCSRKVDALARLKVLFDMSKTLVFYNGAIPKPGQVFAGTAEDLKGKAYFFCHTLFGAGFTVDTTTKN